MDHLGQYNKYIYDQTQQGHPAYFLKVRMSTPRNQSILAFCQFPLCKVQREMIDMSNIPTTMRRSDFSRDEF